MPELQLDGLPQSSSDPSPRDLALVREACAFLAANPEVASSLSIVVHGERSSSAHLAAAAQRIAEEYGLHATFSTKGDSLVAAIARTGVGLPSP